MRKYYPNYSIGTDAYADIPMVCEKYGTKAVICLLYTSDAADEL